MGKDADWACGVAAWVQKSLPGCAGTPLYPADGGRRLQRSPALLRPPPLRKGDCRGASLPNRLLPYFPEARRTNFSFFVAKKVCQSVRVIMPAITSNAGNPALINVASTLSVSHQLRYPAPMAMGTPPKMSTTFSSTPRAGRARRLRRGSQRFNSKEIVCKRHPAAHSHECRRGRG